MKGARIDTHRANLDTCPFCGEVSSVYAGEVTNERIYLIQEMSCTNCGRCFSNRYKLENILMPPREWLRFEYVVDTTDNPNILIQSSGADEDSMRIEWRREPNDSWTARASSGWMLTVAPQYPTRADTNRAWEIYTSRKGRA